MTTFTFGATMLVVGMGGTLLTLYLLTVVIRALTKFLPVRPSARATKT